MKGHFGLVLILGLAADAFASGEFIWPVSGTITSTHVYPDGSYHSGSADIGAGYWTAIGAGRAGNAYAAYQAGGLGYYVRIVHASGYDTLYAHMVQWPSVGGGQWVNTNQLIGYVGSTGYSTGPHVHYAIRRWGTRLVIPGIWIGQWVNRGAAVPGTYDGLSGESTTSGIKALRITADALNVRTGPGTNYAIKGQVYWGQYYISSASSGSWYKIWYDGSEGWVYGGYTTVVSGVSAVKVTTDVLNVRTGPGTGYSIAGQIYSGQMYFWTQYEGLNGWYKIYWRGGNYYIYGNYVTRVGL